MQPAGLFVPAGYVKNALFQPERRPREANPQAVDVGAQALQPTLSGALRRRNVIRPKSYHGTPKVLDIWRRRRDY